MFHGCDGAFDKSGALSRRMREYAELFNGLGLHVLGGRLADRALREGDLHPAQSAIAA